MPSNSYYLCIRSTKFEAIMSKSLLYPNFITKILYESYDKYLIIDMEAISLSLSWLLIDTFDSEKTYGINVRLQSKSL